MDMHSKVMLTQARIIEFYGGYHPGMEYGGAYVSFSGGKDSTVLLHIARQIYPEIPAVFSNTGLEYPEIRKFAKSHDNVEVVQPKIAFNEVISKYGYPLIGKEVAEAIYYARRIVPTERERERADGGHLIQTSGHRNRRTVLTGAYPLHAQPLTTVENSTERERERKRGGTRRRTELNGTLTMDEQQNRERRAGVKPNGQTGVGGVFSNPTEQFGEKSLFNKEKWLPLCRDVPVMISHYCCQKIKKDPLNAYKKRTGRYPIIATMAEESRVRKQAWLRTGCNAFEGKIQSKPMSFWTEQDVMQYIIENDIEICSVYGDIVAVDNEGNEYDPHNLLTDSCKLKCTGCDRTGCIYCGFGAHLEKGETRFQRLARTHPRQYEYCMGGGQWVDNPAYDPVAPEYDGEWKNWNPKQIWVPSKKGLGLKTVFDMVNEIYGKDFYRYE